MTGRRFGWWRPPLSLQQNLDRVQSHKYPLPASFTVCIDRRVTSVSLHLHVGYWYNFAGIKSVWNGFYFLRCFKSYFVPYVPVINTFHRNTHSWSVSSFQSSGTQTVSVSHMSSLLCDGTFSVVPPTCYIWNRVLTVSFKFSSVFFLLVCFTVATVSSFKMQSSTAGNLGFLLQIWHGHLALVPEGAVML